MLVQLVLYIGVFVGSVILAYFILGFVANLIYSPKKASHKAEKVRIAIVTIGSESVRDALMECIEHHKAMFSDYELYCVTDEGADLQQELEAIQGVETIVVPESYTCKAVAKGRAIQYFINTVVAEDPDYWYSFLDDDNLVLDDSFLYEIPYYNQKGYGAMNSILHPRKGKSKITFVMDHVRLLDDLTVFRAFTGFFGRPYIGFHGELLTARGDVLLNVGFDRKTIVEDYAFAAELIKENVKTWQSSTRVSILSPHSVLDLFKQRSRWFIGTWNLLRHTSPITKLATGVRITSWLLAIIAGPIGTIVWWLSGDVPIPFIVRIAPIAAAVVYGGTYLYGTWMLKGWERLPMVFAIPLCAVFEASSPLYAILFSDRDFTVVEK